MPATWRRVALAVAVLGPAALVGCRDHTVLLTFRPEAGTTYDYEVRVVSVTTRRIEDRAPEVDREEARFHARHTVLEAGPAGIRIKVELRRGGNPTRTFVVRYDRAAQLEAVESIEGIPSASLAGLGLSEIFPAAAGAPPDHPLEPGEDWSFDEMVRLPGIGEAAQLTGSGRLEELGVVDGHDVARVASRSELPVEATSRSADGQQLTRRGVLTTHNAAVQDLGDGSVRDVDSETQGRFEIVIEPPAGVSGGAVRGSLTVEVTSETRRTG